MFKHHLYPPTHSQLLTLISEDHEITITLNHEMKGFLFTLHGLLGLSSPSVRNFWDSGLEQTVDTLLKQCHCSTPGIKSILKPGGDSHTGWRINKIII